MRRDLSPVSVSWIGRMTIVLALAAALGGCGSTLKGHLAAGASDTLASSSNPANDSCAATVLNTLGLVVRRVYHEGLESERTAVARRLIEGSAALRQAAESGDAAAAGTAARALLATGHMTDLRVMRGTQTLTDVGGAALAPLRGTLTGAGGAAIASYVTSVWADKGFISEADGVAQGLVVLRANGRSVAGSFDLAPGPLANEGTLTHGKVIYQFSSFPAASFPMGAPLRVYLLKPRKATTKLCGASSEDTLANTLERVANLIYDGEAGQRTLTQIHRVQRNRPLLEAVARRDPAATTAAVTALLHQHVVRLRVSAGAQLLSDIGGPFVLAPVTARLTFHGRTVGSFVLSIQDDEGYLRLTRRLAGLDVLMYMNGSRLVKNSLGPVSGTVPTSGPYTYRGHNFRVFTVHASAFPSGPLVIRVLIPIPYS
jgi:hypothetical protein